MLEHVDDFTTRAIDCSLAVDQCVLVISGRTGMELIRDRPGDYLARLVGYLDQCASTVRAWEDAAALGGSLRLVQLANADQDIITDAWHEPVQTLHEAAYWNLRGLIFQASISEENANLVAELDGASDESDFADRMRCGLMHYLQQRPEICRAGIEKERDRAIVYYGRRRDAEGLGVVGSPGNQTKPPGPVGPSHSKEEAALAVLAAHGDWSDTRIAEEVGVCRTSLYRWPRFVAARRVQKEAGLQHRRDVQDRQTT